MRALKRRRARLAIDASSVLPWSGSAATRVGESFGGRCGQGQGQGQGQGLDIARSPGGARDHVAFGRVSGSKEEKA